MKGVLVARGLGKEASRSVRGAGGRLWPSLERPPIDLAIEAFARAGFDEVCVVVGHSEDVLWQYLDDSARYGIAVYCLHNAQSARGSATAIQAARAFVGGEPFVVALGDYSVGANTLLSLACQPWGTCALSIDGRSRGRKGVQGALRIWVDHDGHVARIGQRLRQWHALATGAFLFQPDVFMRISELLQHGDGSCSITALVRRLISCGQPPSICDVSRVWGHAVGRQDVLVWTAPMLSVRVAPLLSSG